MTDRSTTSGRSWEEYEREYRAEWERNYPNTPWTDVSHGYRYGWEMANDPRYRSKSWGEIESELGTGWGDWDRDTHTHSTGTGLGHQLQHSWDDLKDTVRRGWEKAKAEVREHT